MKLVFIILLVLKDKKFGCVYFDEDKKVWVKIGLKVIGFVLSEFICEFMYVIYFVLLYDLVVIKGKFGEGKVKC